MSKKARRSSSPQSPRLVNQSTSALSGPSMSSHDRFRRDLLAGGGVPQTQPLTCIAGTEAERRRYARCVGVLRKVAKADLPILYEHECDPEAAAMAAFPSRERDAFMTHWARTLANDSALTMTIVADGEVAGNIGCWEGDGRRFVGYWIGREFWGRGLATQALAELVTMVEARPLYAHAVKSNVASIRVLEKCGFVKVGAHAGDDGMEELLRELRA
jgi:RimJ/RimL family protein N-acetyltransferase